MADQQPSADDCRLRVVVPDGAGSAPEPMPRNFIPLRLVLQPGSTYLDLKKPEAVLGRHSKADMRLPLPDVSRRHCRLAWSGGVWRVFDLHSANGTYVNGERVNEATLHPGDTLHVGGFTFTVKIAVDPQATVAFAETSPSDEDVLRSIAAALPTDSFPRRRAS